MGFRFLLVFSLLFYKKAIQQNTKQDLYIELLGQVDDQIMTALRYAVNSITVTNSSLNVHIRKVSVEIGTIDLFNYADSIKDKAVVFMEFEQISYRSCIMSSLTRRPLVSLRKRPQGLNEIEQCSNVMSVYVETESYASAMNKMISENPEWHQIIILYEMEKAALAVQTRLQLTRNLSKIHLLLMRSHGNETADQLLRRIWQTMVKRTPQAIIPLVKENLIRSLLQMDSCSFRKPLTWMIQGEFPGSLTSSCHNVVVGFQLPMKNSSEIENLQNEISKQSDGKYVEKDALFAHDALLLIVKATHEAVQDSYRKNGSLWKESLKEYIWQASVEGVTGLISVNPHLVQVNELQIVNLISNKPVKIGNWTTSRGISLSQPMSINVQSDACKKPPLEGNTLRVVLFEIQPYVMNDTSGKFKEYKGFIIDILNRLANDLKFNFTTEYCADEQYGALINGEWNGVVRKLIDKEADISGVPLAITELRERVVDFTVPFQHSADGLLFARPSEDREPFAFIYPLSDYMWYCLLGTVCIVGVFTHFLNYVSPYGYKDKNGRGAAKEFSFFNSLWFAFACFLQQGISDRPKTLSGRIFSGTYWFCVLIFVSTYTANLTAFFTARSASKTIRSLKDLENTEIAIGVTYASSSYTFFEHTKYEQFQQLWHRMKKFPNTTKQAVEWAKKGHYVHIEASPIIEYAAAQQCNELMTAPGLSNIQGLAFGLQQDSIFKDNITLALLHMVQEGFIAEKLKYWWKIAPSDQCTQTFTPNSLESKKVRTINFLGVYIVLTSGTLFAFIVLIIEIIWFKKSEQRVASCVNSTDLSRTPGEASAIGTFEQCDDIISLRNWPVANS